MTNARRGAFGSDTVFSACGAKEPREATNECSADRADQDSAQVLVPLLKTLQAELGEERAHALVKKALGDLYRKYGETWCRAQGARGLGEKMAAAFENFAAGNALDDAVVKQAPDAFDVDVTGCRYAKFYQAAAWTQGSSTS